MKNQEWMINWIHQVDRFQVLYQTNCVEEQMLTKEHVPFSTKHNELI